MLPGWLSAGNHPRHPPRQAKVTGLITRPLCELLHSCPSQIDIPPFQLEVSQMRKHIKFAIAATIVGLAMVLWTKAGVVETDAIARPMVVLSPPISNPYLPFRVLEPVY
jgi:hypothetical protein